MRLRALKNVLANWLGLGTTMAVGFFLTPFIIHRLGDAAFGLWVLLTTFTGYYGLLDLGLRNAIIRYVARYSTTGERENLSRVVNTCIFSYSILGIALLGVTGLCAWKFQEFFHVTPGLEPTARTLLLVVGVGTALGMPLIVFGGVLEGLQRFRWLGNVQALGSVLRAVLIVSLLNRGYGLLMLGVVTVGVNLLSSLAYWMAVKRVVPQLEYRWAHVENAMLKTLATFGLVTFWIGIAQTLRFQFDAIVIAGFLSLQAVTMFSVSSKIVSYVTMVVQSLAQVFTPMSSEFDAAGDKKQLCRVLLLGNRYSALVMFPLAALMLVLGKSFLRVWVGEAYVASYSVLVILILPTTLYLAQAASTKVLYGMARHKMLAVVLFIEGVANLILSILLLRWFGIDGVAMGTAIPLAATSLFFLPRHLCRLLDLRLRDFLRECYFYPLLLVAPVSLAWWLADRWIAPHTWGGLLVVGSIGGVVYALSLLLYFVVKEPPAHLGSNPAAWIGALWRASTE